VQSACLRVETYKSPHQAIAVPVTCAAPQASQWSRERRRRRRRRRADEVGHTPAATQWFRASQEARTTG